MYSIVSASVLALDLARHPCGAAVADTVDRVLALTTDDLVALAAAQDPTPARAAARARVLETCALAPRMSGVLRGVTETLAVGMPAPEHARLLVDTVSGTLLGSLEDLHAMLLREQPLRDAPVEAVQVVLDAVTVAWAGRADGVELSTLSLLRAPWVAALSPVPVPLAEHALGRQGAAVRALLEQVARTSPQEWERVVAAHEGTQGSLLGWSTAMHEASRVAYEHDRLLPVARAQLALARALRLSGVSALRTAQAAGLAATAALQATCVLDLLPADCAEVLLSAWRARTAGVTPQA